jgi:crotonobetainyl-CoA:carnitine CoA-transferase CaiB-like acyl-CoA transferase
MGDLLASDHLKARGFFAELHQPGMEPFAVPGAPYKFSQTPWQIRSPAPALGQHTDRVLAELGLSANEVERLRHDAIV